MGDASRRIQGGRHGSQSDKGKLSRGFVDSHSTRFGTEFEFFTAASVSRDSHVWRWVLDKQYLLSDMVGPVKNIAMDWHIQENSSNAWMMQELFIRST